jgi:hypothetical protein
MRGQRALEAAEKDRGEQPKWNYFYRAGRSGQEWYRFWNGYGYAGELAIGLTVISSVLYITWQNGEWAFFLGNLGSFVIGFLALL